MHIGRGDRLKSAIFAILDIHDIDFDLATGHMTCRHVALINLYLHTKFRSNRINFFWMGSETDFITLRRRPKNGKHVTDNLVS